MKGWLFIIYFFFVGILAEAQMPEATSEGPVYSLKIIDKKNGAYYYGNTKITNWAALSIPFAELNEGEVNLRYRQYKTLNSVGQVISWIPTVYFLANLNQEKNTRSGAYWAVLLTSLAGSMTCNWVAQKRIKQAIVHYNHGISRKTGFRMNIEPDKNTWGLAIHANF